MELDDEGLLSARGMSPQCSVREPVPAFLVDGVDAPTRGHDEPARRCIFQDCTVSLGSAAAVATIWP
jgi:hypothetical protein